jgi:hypothetical protein
MLLAYICTKHPTVMLHKSNTWHYSYTHITYFIDLTSVLRITLVKVHELAGVWGGVRHSLLKNSVHALHIPLGRGYLCEWVWGWPLWGCPPPPTAVLGACVSFWRADYPLYPIGNRLLFSCSFDTWGCVCMWTPILILWIMSNPQFA